MVAGSERTPRWQARPTRHSCSPQSNCKRGISDCTVLPAIPIAISKPQERNLHSTWFRISKSSSQAQHRHSDLTSEEASSLQALLPLHAHLHKSSQRINISIDGHLTEPAPLQPPTKPDSFSRCVRNDHAASSIQKLRKEHGWECSTPSILASLRSCRDGNGTIYIYRGHQRSVGLYSSIHIPLTNSNTDIEAAPRFHQRKGKKMNSTMRPRRTDQRKVGRLPRAGGQFQKEKQNANRTLTMRAQQGRSASKHASSVRTAQRPKPSKLWISSTLKRSSEATVSHQSFQNTVNNFGRWTAEIAGEAL